MKNWVCDGLVIFRGATDGLLCARGCRTSRSGCSGGPVSWEWWISLLKQSAIRLRFAWLTSVSGACHIELDELQFEKHEEQNKSQNNS